MRLEKEGYSKFISFFALPHFGFVAANPQFCHGIGQAQMQLYEMSMRCSTADRVYCHPLFSWSPQLSLGRRLWLGGDLQCRHQNGHMEDLVERFSSAWRLKIHLAGRYQITC